MKYPIKVYYNHTSNLLLTRKWLDNLPDEIACDFEVSSIHSEAYKSLVTWRILNNYYKDTDKLREAKQVVVSNGLSYPEITTITHLSIAWSEDNAIVLIVNSKDMLHLITNFLVQTERKQIWHNATFDLGRVYYVTRKFPKNIVDTQLLAKCLKNNADSSKDRTGLKELMGYAYGDWAISKEQFTLEEMWNESMIRYAATDACATYKLYRDLLETIKAKRG